MKTMLAQVEGLSGLVGEAEFQMVCHPFTGATAKDVFAIPFLDDLGAALGIADPTSKGYGALCLALWTELRQVLGEEGVRLSDDLDFRKVRLSKGLASWLGNWEQDPPSERGLVRCHALPVRFAPEKISRTVGEARLDALLANAIPLCFVQVVCVLLQISARKDAFPWPAVYCSGTDYHRWEMTPWSYVPVIHRKDDWVYVTAVQMKSPAFRGSIAFSAPLPRKRPLPVSS